MASLGGDGDLTLSQEAPWPRGGPQATEEESQVPSSPASLGPGAPLWRGSGASGESAPAHLPCPLSLPTQKQVLSPLWFLSHFPTTPSAAETRGGFRFASFPAAHVHDGLGTYRALPLCLRLVLSLLRGTGWPGLEATQLRLSPVARVGFGVRRPGADLNAAPSWLCAFQPVTETL